MLLIYTQTVNQQPSMNVTRVNFIKYKNLKLEGVRNI